MITGMPPTARSYVGQGYRITATCRGCGRIAALDLAALIAAGKGHIPLIELPLRCAACGGRDSLITVHGPDFRPGA